MSAETRKARKEIVAVLETGLNVYERRLNALELEAIARRYLKRSDRLEWRIGHDRLELVRDLAAHLKGEIRRRHKDAYDLRRRYSEFSRCYARSQTVDERQFHVLELARGLGAKPSELEKDRRAFARSFGQDAITDRYEFIRSKNERLLALCIDRLGVLCRSALDAEAHPGLRCEAWKHFGLEDLFHELISYDGDRRILTEAFRCFARALSSLPPRIQSASIGEDTLTYVHRCAMHTRLDVWLQCEAVALVETLAPHSLQSVLECRLAHPAPGDDLFVRRRVVEVLLRNLGKVEGCADLLGRAAKDPSPLVRQGLAEKLVSAPAEIALVWLERLALDDETPQVRAAALLACVPLCERESIAPALLELWARFAAKETDRFALRVACEVAARAVHRLSEGRSGHAREWAEALTSGLERLHVGAKDVQVRRWAAQARERIWCDVTPEASALCAALAREIARMRSGQRRRLPRDLLEGLPDDLVGRVLSVLAQEDFGLELERRWYGSWLTRGHRFTRKLWRTWHELRNPSSDKRQAFPHTVGRHFRGDINAPSGILAELAETKVPGEPLHISEEGGWRPYLPLLDHLVSLLRPLGRTRPAKLYTSEGVVELLPPSTWRARIAAFVKLARGFPAYAKLRNWRESSQDPARKYLETMAKLGFRCQLRPHAGMDGSALSIDPAVGRFFPALLPIFGPELWSELQEYFVSIYENSLLELGVFVTVALGLFAGRHLLQNLAIQRLRRKLPLVVGGWGTRGKSGTERIKAALFNALGYGIVSKTTGCEAMFLYAFPFGKLKEMFLYRPYDKATIWEQHNLVRLAVKLDCEVFLWECMALTPGYVEILQRSWMRDDLSTLTNAYPDHEDLQGPAGCNIPEVMTNFIPRRSKMMTSEDQMLPILEEGALSVETPVKRVTWLECGLLTPDVIKRFPYDEHPNNIALVIALAEELGMTKDFALKEMADRVVADLGVLKTYAAADVYGRNLQMVNGMSANERHGSLGNWTRLGFDRQDPVAEPGVWLTTVVNNRADRVPRSKVFAKMLVDDISADRHFLIGTNLTGLVGFIRQSWDAYAADLRLWGREDGPSAAEIFNGLARRMRVPWAREHVAAKLKVMLSGLGAGLDTAKAAAILDDPETLHERLADTPLRDLAGDIVAHVKEDLGRVREYEAFAERIAASSSADRSAVEAELRDLVWKWFQRKLVVVHDPYTPGEKIIATIANETPPGFLNRVMGMQNIKGTGLDYIYRWQAWETCYRACVDLHSRDPAQAQAGLKALASFQEYGLLSEKFVRDTITLVKTTPFAQKESIQAELAVISANLDAAMAVVREKVRGAQGNTSALGSMINTVEKVLEAGDAVRRRKCANAIYRDMAGRRIGLERAVLELQKLTKRQKGGWLVETLRAAQAALGRRAAGLFTAILKSR